MSSAFNKFRVECENQIQKSEVRIEESYVEVRRQMDEFSQKLQRVEDTEVLKKWVNNLFDYKITDCTLRIDKCNQNIKDSIE